MATDDMKARLELLEKKLDRLSVTVEALPTKDDLIAFAKDITDQVRIKVTGYRDQMKIEVGGYREQMRIEVGGYRDQMKFEVGGYRDQMRIEVGGYRDQMRMDVADYKDQMRIMVEDYKDSVQKAAEGYSLTLDRIERELRDLNAKVDTTFSDHARILADHRERISALERT